MAEVEDGERMTQAKPIRYQDETDEKRFWNKVSLPVPGSGCMEWLGSTNKQGYGVFWDVQEQRRLRAHRVSYLLRSGTIPPGLQLDHLCRNRRCVRPDHLDPVTVRENLLRGQGLAALHASKTHCPRGHEYTPENTRHYRGSRYCRACFNLDQKQRRRREKERANS